MSFYDVIDGLPETIDKHTVSVAYRMRESGISTEDTLATVYLYLDIWLSRFARNKDGSWLGEDFKEDFLFKINAKTHNNIEIFFGVGEMVSEMISAPIKGVGKAKEKKPGHVYILKSGKYYKIGRSKNMKARMKKYVTENPNEVEIIHCFEVYDSVESERLLKDMFKDKLHNRERFNLDKEDIKKIKKMK